MSTKSKCQLDEERKKKEDEKIASDEKKKKEKETTREPYDKERLTFFSLERLI